MKVLFVAAEGAPFVKTGGLGDVIGSLPKELRKLELEVGVILPKYRDIPEHFQKEMVLIKTLIVPLGWRKQFCSIEKLVYAGVPFYFIDNENYFNRSGYYSYWDDGERYAFFCRAVLEALPYLDFQPDILHCHDWHTGMVSVLLEAGYRKNSFYQQLRTVFTIHNLKYQGIFPKEILRDLLGLDDSYFKLDGVEFYGQVSFMKGGISFSDLITTVSKTYAEEIQYPYFGERLDGLLREKNGDLFGIINGIDYEEYNPLQDPHIAQPYDSNSLINKRVNKVSLQKRLGLPGAKVPLIAMVTRLADQKGLDLVAHVLEEMLALEIQLVILGTGAEKHSNLFRMAANRFSDKVSANILYDDFLAHKIYAGADFFLMPSLFEPCGLSQLIAMRYGTIPIVRKTGGLNDTVASYDEETGLGSGFTFNNYNAHEMLAAVERAIALYYQEAQWAALCQQVMELDFSWSQPAQIYRALYQQVLKRNI